MVTMKDIELVNSIERISRDLNKIIAISLLHAKNGNITYANIIANEFFKGESGLFTKEQIIILFYRNSPLTFNKDANGFKKTRSKEFKIIGDNEQEVTLNEDINRISQLSIFNMPIYSDDSEKNVYIDLDIDEIFYDLIEYPKIIDKLSYVGDKNLKTEEILCVLSYIKSKLVGTEHSEVNVFKFFDLFFKVSKVNLFENNSEYESIKNLLSFGEKEIVEMSKFGITADKKYYNKYRLRYRRK